MIHIKDHKQRDMFNSFAHLGPKRLALLESSWAHLFREEILHKLPAEKLFPFYDVFQGRKTKELYAPCSTLPSSSRWKTVLMQMLLTTLP